MPSDGLPPVIAIIVPIGIMLLAWLLARAMARKQLAATSRIPPAAPARPTPPAGPILKDVVLAQFGTPVGPRAVVRERPTRRLNLTDTRKGIVLATILGPCRAHSPDEEHRP